MAAPLEMGSQSIGFNRNLRIRSNMIGSTAFAGFILVYTLIIGPILEIRMAAAIFTLAHHTTILVLFRMRERDPQSADPTPRTSTLACIITAYIIVVLWLVALELDTLWAVIRATTEYDHGYGTIFAFALIEASFTGVESILLLSVTIKCTMERRRLLSLLQAVKFGLMG